MDGNGVDPLPEDVAAWRELARRLSMPLDPYEGVAEARILVGRLPKDLPMRLPIPDGSTVVGSVTRSLSRGHRSVEVLLDAAPSAGQVREDYRRQLQAAKWREEDNLPGRGGFNPRGMPLLFRAAYRFPRLRRALQMDRKDFPAPFRLGASGPRLMVMAQDRPDAPTDVRLHLTLGRRDLWLRHDDALTAVPTLYLPPDVRGRPDI